MFFTEAGIREKLLSLRDEKYAQFSKALIPNCTNLIGVRIPEIRKLAKKFSKQDALFFLEKTQEVYFEETMLKGFLIGDLKEEIEVVLAYVQDFIPHLTNWSLCDSFCSALKITKKHKEKVWEFLQVYLSSKQTYEIRFGLVMLIFYYVEDCFLEEIFSYCNAIKHQDYYVKMAIAWLVSICFIKFPEKTLAYLKNNQLEDETYNKALQKIRESLRVDNSTKELIKQMKRKS